MIMRQLFSFGRISPLILSHELALVDQQSFVPKIRRPNFLSQLLEALAHLDLALILLFLFDDFFVLVERVQVDLVVGVSILRLVLYRLSYYG